MSAYGRQANQLTTSLKLSRQPIAVAFCDVVPQNVPDGYIAHFGPELTLRRTTMRANAQQVNSLRPYVVEIKERYPGLNLPVEILHGTEDTIVPLAIHSEPLSRQIPGAVLTRMEGIGHTPHHADPQAVVDAIDRVAARAGLR